MSREPDLDMYIKNHPHIPELSLIALAAYNNGAPMVILTKDKVFMASTDEMDMARADAAEALGEK